MGEGRRDVRLDPAVAAALGDADRRQRARHMTAGQRRQAARDAERQRVTLELAPELVARVREIAEREGCSPAGVVNVMLMEGLPRYEAGEIDFGEYVRPSRCPRYLWIVDVKNGPGSGD